MAVVRRIGPGSAFKVGLVLYAVIGLVMGLFIAGLSGIAGSLAPVASQGGLNARSFGMGMGMGAIIIVPILYGIIGGLIAALMAVIYNVVAGWVGGLEVDIS